MDEKSTLLRRNQTPCWPKMQSPKWDSLFAKKSIGAVIAEEDTSGGENNARLTRSINLLELIAFGIGTTVGSGIYALVSSGAKTAGPAVFLSYLIGAISCIFTGLAYTEFASRIPVAGSAYTYTYTFAGECLAWLVGWNLTLEVQRYDLTPSFSGSFVFLAFISVAIGSAVTARSWTEYLRTLTASFGGSYPYWIDKVPVKDDTFNPLAAIVVFACTVIVLLGIKESMRVNLVITAVNVCMLLFFIVAGATVVDHRNWEPLAPYGTGAIFAASGSVFFAYIGFDQVAMLAEEVKNPKRDMPVGIIGSLLLSGGIYVGVSLVLCGAIPFQLLGGAPLSQALEYHGMRWQAKVISFGALAALSASTLTGLMAQPRVFYRMARDGLMPRLFGDDSGNIPRIGVCITGFVTACIAFFINESILAEAISIGTLSAFSMVDAGIVITRLRSQKNPYRSPMLLLAFTILCFLASVCYTQKWSIIAALAIAAVACLPLMLLFFEPHDKSELESNSFKCPWVPLLPCLGIAINCNMLSGLSSDSWLRLAVWTIIGILIYGFFGYHNSRQRKAESSNMKNTASS